MKFYLLVLPWLLVAGCRKKDPTPADPAAQLPPATQTGANTFGCLLNGQPWTPSGNDGVPNYRITYDPGYAGGSLVIRVYRYPDNTSKFQSMTFGGDRIAQPGVYPFVLVGDRKAFFADHKLAPPCEDFSEAPSLTYRTGNITITRLDLAQGIISGTFTFKLAKPGCDTVRVTSGRFDKRL